MNAAKVAADRFPRLSSNSRATTEVAEIISRRVAAARAASTELAAGVGAEQKAARESLREAYSECSEPGWDGYGALPADSDSASRAEEVAFEVVPMLGQPHFSFDPEGHAMMEWELGPGCVLDMIVGPRSEIYYAARFGGVRQTGSEDFSDGLPSGLRHVVQRMAASH